MIWHLSDLIKSAQTCQASKGGDYVPARPLNFLTIGDRFRHAWIVFSGKGDVVLWPNVPEEKSK